MDVIFIRLIPDMPRSTPTFAVLLVVCCCVSLAQDARAGLAADITTCTVSLDGKLILVHISADALEDELSHPSVDQSQRVEIRRLRAIYSQSGLYRNNSSTKPLWTYDGPLGVNIIIAPDGQHLIIEGDWTSNEYGLSAVTFVRNGMVTRYYHDTEIIPQWMLKALLNGLSPPACAKTFFNPTMMTYTIRTNQNEEIIFGVKSGGIIDVRSPFPFFYAIALTVPSIIVSLILIRWRQQRASVRTAGLSEAAT
jgi:hypothetical protein